MTSEWKIGRKKVDELKSFDEVLSVGHGGLLTVRSVKNVTSRPDHDGDDLFSLVVWFDESSTAVSKIDEVLVLDLEFHYEEADRR